MKKFTLLLAFLPLLQAQAQNPLLLKDVRPGSSGSATTEIMPTTYGNTFFNADDNGSGNRGLWRTDGTQAGTIKLNLTYPGFITSAASMLTPLGVNRIFFAGDNTSGYGEAWVSDGTQTGTITLEGIFPTQPINFAPVMSAAPLGGLVIYAAYTNDNHVQIKKTNGTAASTVMVYDFGPGKVNTKIPLMKNVGNLVYFDYYDADGLGGDNVYATDGNATFIVGDLPSVAGTTSQFGVSSYFMPTSDGVYFMAQDNTGTTTLFKASGTGTFINTAVVKTLGSAYNTFPAFDSIGNTLYFAFDDGTHGKELWKTDGTAAGTVMVADINAGAGASNPSNFTVMNNTLYFTANMDINQDGLTNETVLMSYDGTTVNPIMEVSPNSANVSNIAVCNNTLLFSATTATGSELWVSNGLSNNTQVADINPGAASSSPALLATAGNAVYFTATNAATGQEVYKYTAPTTIWTGIEDDNWNNANNWIPANVPAATDNVLVSATQTLPTITQATVNSLTVNGGVSSTGGNITVNGDFYSSGTVNMGPGGAITIANPATTTTHLFGSTQSITSNVTASANTNITLSTNTVINGALGFSTVARHAFYLGTNNLTVNQILNATDTSFIITNDTGSLTLTNIGSSKTVFPVGISSSSYTPLTITNSGTVDNFSLRVAPNVLQGGSTGDTIKQQAVNRTWLLEEGTPGGSNVTLTAQWNAIDELPLFNRQTVYLNHYTGSKWDAGSQSVATGSDPYTVSRNGITSFSPFAVSSTSSILPISLTAFTATKTGEAVLLNWQTATEINSDHFNIQRSFNGTDFTVIGVQQAAVNSSTLNNYSYTDNIGKLTGMVYYRLQEVDKNGKTSLSVVRSINTGNIGFSFFPNPAKNTVTVTGSNLVYVNVYTAAGKLVISQNLANTNNTLLNIGNLAKGVYLVVAKDAGGNTQTQKLTVE